MFGSALSAHRVQLITSSGPCDVDMASRMMGRTAPLRAEAGPSLLDECSQLSCCLMLNLRPEEITELKIQLFQPPV